MLRPSGGADALALTLLLAAPGLGGTWLSVAHPCPVDMPWLAQGGHAGHGARTGHGHGQTLPPDPPLPAIASAPARAAPPPLVARRRSPGDLAPCDRLDHRSLLSRRRSPRPSPGCAGTLPPQLHRSPERAPARHSVTEVGASPRRPIGHRPARRAGSAVEESMISRHACCARRRWRRALAWWRRRRRAQDLRAARRRRRDERRGRPPDRRRDRRHLRTRPPGQLRFGGTVPARQACGSAASGWRFAPSATSRARRR